MEMNVTEELPAIRLTKHDFARLDSLLAAYNGGQLSKAADFLLRELSRASVVEAAEIPADVVTMHSQVLFRDDLTGRKRSVTLVYPPERGFSEDAVSIMTPLGTALIGLAEGQSISFEGADGASRRVSVVKVFHQPQAAGQ